MSTTRTLDLIYISMFTAILAVCTWITVPGTIPFTMQTFGVFLALLMVGGKRGTTAIIVYILVGLVGLPVFSGFNGGPGVLFGPTGGYIIGFILTGLIYWAAESLGYHKKLMKAAVLVLGLAVCYAFGTIWFMQVYMRNSGGIGVTAALSMCVLPFVIPDLVKLALAFMIAERTRRFLR